MMTVADDPALHLVARARAAARDAADAARRPSGARERAPGPAPTFVYGSLGGSSPVRADWSGHVVGPVTIAPRSLIGSVSPDGTLVLTRSANPVLVAEDGTVVARVPLSASYWIWADDSRHYCEIDRRTGDLGSAPWAPRESSSPRFPSAASPYRRRRS